MPEAIIYHAIRNANFRRILGEGLTGGVVDDLLRDAKGIAIILNITATALNPKVKFILIFIFVYINNNTPIVLNK